MKVMYRQGEGAGKTSFEGHRSYITDFWGSEREFGTFANAEEVGGEAVSFHTALFVVAAVCGMAARGGVAVIVVAAMLLLG